MQISELEAQLKELREKYGDTYVWVWCCADWIGLRPEDIGYEDGDDGAEVGIYIGV